MLPVPPQGRPVLSASSRPRRVPLPGLVLAFLAVLVAALWAAPFSADAQAASSTKTFAAGSLVIPMDTDTTGNHAAYNQNAGMWKAYGLVYRLLQNGIPVNWGINASKSSVTDIDLSVTSKDKRTGTALGNWDYRGGPFIIDSADAAAAMPIIQSWWAAKGNQPNVHETTASVTADVNITLRSAPRIANEAINSGITIAYYNAAGIPDLNGNPWSSTSPNILDESEIAAGGLFNQGSVCLQRKFDTFVTPHNSGYSYSLSDPNNLGTKTYSQLDTFVHQGGGWTALCHSILSNENAIADLTRNGSAAVKSMFKTSLPGGKPGGFLTTTGFTTIDNTTGGGTWKVDSAWAKLPTAQLVPTTGATQTLPGGSVQTWPSQGNPGAPTYWGNTERVAYFDTPSSSLDHDHIISGTYHDGTGLGKLTYIGGHSFATSVPYSGNYEAPYLRAFYNSLFFNGSAVAKLDLQTSPTTFPQNGTGTLSASILNTGGSVATNVGNVSVTLAPGFVYVGTTSGPAPSVSLDGRTLTWLGGLGDVNGGETAVKFDVQVLPSVSGTTGAKQLGTFHATYGDFFGEGFTADVCRDITIAPVPAPKLSKTPASQGPVTAGSTVTWTLPYGNTGSTPLQSAVLQDTLPPGFSYVSSSSSPSLGSPTVIPAPSGTIVRWNVGTIPAGTPSAGSVTITARAGSVTAGTGDPLQQTFTNAAKLTGKDADGNPYTANASADVIVQKLDLTLDKTVDKTFLTSLPGNVTYTLTPRSDTSDLLENARVVDPLPAGVTSPPVSVGQGGTYGAYTPLAAVPGNDPGPPTLDTAMSVSTNTIAQGGSVTVTLNVKSSSAITSVSPTDLGIDGGSATCAGPSPGTANVPAGGAGVNFVWTCTLDDLGEYTFSAAANDATATTSWPEATSASVLSHAGGGPNVVTWNLGSNTPAVGGSTVTAGSTAGIFGLRGAGQDDYQKYDLQTGSWVVRANAPANVAKGGALTTDGAGTVYELTGNNRQDFNAYAVSTNTWSSKANTGTNVGEGGALTFLGTSAYAFMGNGTTTFKRYDPGANSWTTMTAAPGAVKKGGSLTTDGTNIYALQGNNTNKLWRYNVGSNTWTTTLANVPGNVNWGGALTRVGSYLYATIGGGKNKFYRYNIGANTWTAMANTPANVTDGGALTTDGTNVYAFQGKSKAFWRYDVATNKWSVLAQYPPGSTGQGGALVYAPATSLQGRFSTLSASRSLVSTGDQVKVTMTFDSTTPVSNVTAGSLTVTPANGASCSSLAGPVLKSADTTISASGDTVVYEWTCTVAAGTSPGSLTFSAGGSGSGPVTFPAATSNSVLVAPPLTYTVTVPIGAPNPVTNVGFLGANGDTTSSPQVATYSGSPKLEIVKSNTPGEGTTVKPGDPITYSMTVQNTGSGTATGVTVADQVPTNTSYTSCSGGTGCSQAAGTVTWTIGTLAPGATATVTFTVNVSQSLPISATPYTIANTATANSTQTSPVSSNTVTNKVEVKPTITKSVDKTDAAPGETLTYTLTVSNPGAAFTADVTDPIPANTTFGGTCTPACTTAGGSVVWNGVTIQPGDNTFTFKVTVSPGTGGKTITNAGVLDPTSPNLDPIPSNEAVTHIGPELEIVKSNNPTGPVQNGDHITYTLVVSNESQVAATGVVVSDPVPVGTTYDNGSCSTPAGTCSLSNGKVVFQVGSLAGYGTVTVSFSVTVGTPPLGTFQIENQAKVTAANSPDPALSNPVYNPLPVPALELTKTASPQTYKVAGDVITYTYVVTNNSTTTTLAGPVTVSDDKATVTCPPGDLAPLASVVCTATYTITAADVTSGSVTNTAQAQAGAISSNQAQATVKLFNPAVQLDKSAALDITVVPPPTQADSGDQINYTLKVTNTGNVTLTDVIVTDPLTGTSCALAALDPGDVDTTCTATYTVTQADINSGAVINTAFVAAKDPQGGTVGDNDQATVPLGPAPALTLAKSAAESSFNSASDVLHYSYTVTNAGNVSLAGPVTVTDNKATVTCPNVNTVGNNDGSLDPGETIVCTATYAVTQADLDAGKVTNKATAHADGTDSNQDTRTVNADQQPAIDIQKLVQSTDQTVVAPGTRWDAGDTIEYVLRVKNTGNVTLTNVLVTDPKTGVNCNLGTLAPGAIDTTCTTTYAVTLADINGGSAVNTATVTAKDPNTNTVTDSDTKTVPLAPVPALTLTKTAAETSFTAVGETLHYSYKVENTGNVTLAGPITVTDDKTTVTCPAVAFLDPGNWVTCTATYTVTQADLNAGKVTNTATAHTPSTDSNQDSETVDAAQHASIQLDKTPSLDITVVAPADRVDSGDKITYTLKVTNTGNVTLTNVVVTDPLTGTTCVLASLAPGAVDTTCTATYTIAQADINGGSVSNTASVTAKDPSNNPVTDTDTATVPLVPVPQLSLTKSVTESSYAAVGDVLHYSYLVKNTGNVTLAGPVTVSDDKASVSCPAGSLAPNATVTCTASYPVTQADLNAGSVTNHATAHANGTDSNPDSRTVNANQQPSIDIQKIATPNMAVVAPNTRFDAGDTISYTFKVKNTGNVTLTNVVVTDPLTATNCLIGTLAPGATDQTCTATYTVTQANINTGAVSNTATVTGKDPHGDPVPPDTDTVLVPLPADPKLSLTKTAAESSYVAVGDVLHYSYTVKNTGNVSLAGPVTVSDDRTSVTCPNVTTVGNNNSSLDPGETIVCTASYSVTQADLNAGSVTNHATAHANGTDSNPDSKTVNANQQPALTLKKTATESSYVAVGDVLHYSYSVKNTGNVSLAGPVTVSDDKASVTCPSVTTVGNNNSALDPGETIVCTASHTVTQADLNAGSVTNHATAHAGGTDSNQDTVTVNADQQPKLKLTKTAAESSFTAAGDTLHYSYKVENTGNVRLAGPVTVSDDKTSVTCPNVTTVGNNDSYLDPGESLTCTATYTTTGADVTATAVTNHATAHASGTDSNTDSVTVPAAGIDLSITKSDSADPIVRGSELSYSISVKNNSPSGTAQGVVVTDTLPTGTSYVTSAGGTCNALAGIVTCTLPNLAPGSTVTFTIKVAVLGSAPVNNDPSSNPESGHAGSSCPVSGADLCNLVSVSSSTFDGDSSNNSYVQNTNVLPEADLKVVKTEADDPVVRGAQTTYTLQVTNQATLTTAQSVVVTDTLDPNTSFVSASPGCSILAGVVTCNLGDLAPGQVKTVTITVDVSSAAPDNDTSTAPEPGYFGAACPLTAYDLCNRASVATSTPEVSTGDNAYVQPTNVLPKAQLSVVKTDGPDPVYRGQNLTYTLTVTNDSTTTPAQNVQVNDTLDANSTFVSASGASCANSGSLVTCNLGTLAPGQVKTFTIVVKVGNGAPINNTPGTGAQAGSTGTSCPISDLCNKVAVSTSTPLAPSAGNNYVQPSNVIPAIAPTVTTQASAATIDLGQSVHDTATLSSGPSGTYSGTITFKLYKNTTCSGSPEATVSTTVSGGDGNYTSPSVTPAHAGTYYWVASFTAGSPNAADSAQSSCNDPNEKVVVAPAQPTLTTDASNGGVAPATINDVATLAGGPATSYTGTLTFKLYDNGTCSGSPVATVTKAVNGGNGTYASPSTSVATPGTYYWVAKFVSSDPDVADAGETACNDPAEKVTIDAPAVDDADLSIVKTASTPIATPGSDVTYTLTVHNNGPADALGVTITDKLAPELSFQSADPGCSYNAGNRTVTCSIASIPAGGTVSRDIVVQVDSNFSFPTASPQTHDHWINVQKVEQFVDLDPGESTTETLTCPNGAIMTDGSPLVQDVDQDTGTLADVKIISSQSISPSSYRFELRNDASGRAQVKLFGVCVDKQTQATNGHAHLIGIDPSSGAPNTDTLNVPSAGRWSIDMQCPTGTTPIAPGFDFVSGSGISVGSEVSADGLTWTFTFDTDGAASIKVSSRCLTIDGTQHSLGIKHVVKHVTVPPTGPDVAKIYKVECGQQDKGIVGTYLLGKGLILAGHQPVPVAREFSLINPTDQPIEATLDLVCLHTRTVSSTATGDGHIPNTAKVTFSSGSDPNQSNNSDSVTITITPGPAVNNVAVTPSTLRSGGKGQVRFRLSKSGPVQAKIVQVVPSRTRSASAPRMVRVTMLRMQGHRGRNTLRFRAIVGRKALPAGDYRVRLRSRDSHGRWSGVAQARFRVIAANGGGH